MEVWAEPKARRFAIFVFVSMLAYSAQDLILEPFAGVGVRLHAGRDHQALGRSAWRHADRHGAGAADRRASIRGRAATCRSGPSAAAWLRRSRLLGLAAAAMVGPSWPLRETVFVLGVTNGAYAVAAIGSMMALVGAGGEKREGVRMGLWGAAQAFAFGLGGFLGTLASDLARYLLSSPALSYAVVFAAEAACSSSPPCWRSGFIARRGTRRIAASRDLRRRDCGRMRCMAISEMFDVVVVGGGPAGATAAHDLASLGRTRAAARPRRTHQAVRRRDSAAADPRFRHSRPSAGRARQLRAHGVAVGQAGRHADRRRLRRHGRPRGVRRMAAGARGAGRRGAADRPVQALRARRRRHDRSCITRSAAPTARSSKRPFAPAR